MSEALFPLTFYRNTSRHDGYKEKKIEKIISDHRPRKKEQQILDKLTDIESDIKGVEIALEERNLEEEIENEDNTMIIAIAAGVGCLFMLSILLVVACCISRKVIFFIRGAIWSVSLNYVGHFEGLSLHKYL